MIFCEFDLTLDILEQLDLLGLYMLPRINHLENAKNSAKGMHYQENPLRQII